MAVSGGVWDRIDVSGWPVRVVETAGSNKGTWLLEPEADVLWLHKSIKVPSHGFPQGEDWAEVAATRVAELLGVPCAEARLCLRGGVRGSLSRSVTPDGCDLNEGGVLLEAAGVPGYFRQTDSKKSVDPDRADVMRPGHSLANIQTVLNGVLPPPSFQGPAGLSGFDVFVGYLILDALVANPDRHEQNWAVLRPRLTGQPDRLAPSYDHGGSLGYQLSDAKREYRLVSESALHEWAERGTAHRFEHVRLAAPTLVSHAVAATALCSPQAAEWWRYQLDTIDLGPLHAALAAGIPGMSVPAAKFTSRLLDTNLRRLRDAICGGS